MTSFNFLFYSPTLLLAMSDTERWVWMVSNWSRHQSSSSSVSNDIRRKVSSKQRRPLQLSVTLYHRHTSDSRRMKVGSVLKIILAWLLLYTLTGLRVMESAALPWLADCCTICVSPRSKYQDTRIVTYYVGHSFRGLWGLVWSDLINLN